MKVNYNAVEKMDLEGVYLRKICQCSSDLTITNGDVLKLSTDESGMVTIVCLCCDTELKLRRVFSKKCYTMEQFTECVDKLRDENLPCPRKYKHQP